MRRVQRFKTTSPGILWASLALLLPALSGCVYSTATTIGAAAAADEVEEEQQFDQTMIAKYQSWMTAVESSGCPHAEYRLEPRLIAFVAEEGDSGLEEARERLRPIVVNDAAAPSERAEALYHLAVMAAEGDEPNDILALEHLDRMAEAFPGQRPCARTFLRKRIEARRALQPAVTQPD